jgi:aspartyl-tRNA(Asn)/glutamyl-tRNA(Gln) amidotransferase subunit A
MSQLEQKGAIVDEVDVPLFNDVLPVYYALMPAEVTTNLGRFDGLRFGQQSDTNQYESLHDYYTAIRSQFIGDEVRRRIIT